MGRNGEVAGAHVGADVELGKWDLLAKIGLTLENVDKRLAEEAARRERAIALVPGDPLLSGTGISGSSGDLTFDCCNTAPGINRVWQVRHIMVGGVQATSTVSGTAYFYRSVAPPADLSLINLMDIASLPMPQPAFYGTHQFIVHPPERIWCVIHTPTASTQYAAAVQVEDWAAEAFGSRYSE